MYWCRTSSSHRPRERPDSLAILLPCNNLPSASSVYMHYRDSQSVSDNTPDLLHLMISNGIQEVAAPQRICGGIAGLGS